jgi:hypothetical protein
MSEFFVYAEVFGLSSGLAVATMNEVASVVRSWGDYAGAARIPRSEQSRFRRVFDAHV